MSQSCRPEVRPLVRHLRDMLREGRDERSQGRRPHGNRLPTQGCWHARRARHRQHRGCCWAPWRGADGGPRTSTFRRASPPTCPPPPPAVPPPPAFMPCRTSALLPPPHQLRLGLPAGNRRHFPAYRDTSRCIVYLDMTIISGSASLDLCTLLHKTF